MLMHACVHAWNNYLIPPSYRIWWFSVYEICLTLFISLFAINASSLSSIFIYIFNNRFLDLQIARQLDLPADRRETFRWTRERNARALIPRICLPTCHPSFQRFFRVMPHPSLHSVRRKVNAPRNGKSLIISELYNDVDACMRACMK